MSDDFLIDPEIKQNILQTLTDIEAEHDVHILHAAESGSRAWGFPSPDSDYDVRFFYIHKKDWYLSIYPERDVIEKPINKVYDVSGWDLKKALHLALKSNAVVMEWLQSPITYITNEDFRKDFKNFCIHNFDRKALMHHYLSLGERQLDQAWRTQETTHVKKYFYMLRPAIALRCLIHNEGHQSLPMNLQELMSKADIPVDITAITEDLIAKKRTMKEKEKIERIAELDEFIEQEFKSATEYLANLPARESLNTENANAFFIKWLDHYAFV